MTSNSFFFRVEHDLLRSEAFKTLGGSAIKVYLVIGLYSDFGTDWAYPSIRTIARQAGLSRQTVLVAIEELTRTGLLAASKARGRSTAYRIIRQAPQRPTRSRTAKRPEEVMSSGPLSLEDAVPTGLFSLVDDQESGRPEEEQPREEDTTTIPIPGTPFRLTADGRLHVAVDLQELLTNQGIPDQLARRLVAQKDPEAVAKVLLNAIYLQSEGKLQNGPGYIRAGIEDGYDLLPQVANRLEMRRRELEDQLRMLDAQQKKTCEARERAAEEAAITYVLEQLRPETRDQFLKEALRLLPEPIARRNPTLSNPFVRAKVYELACGDPQD
jgi:hypothetical protein